MSNEHRRTISLSTKVYTRLRNCGQFGESFNDVIDRLVDALEQNQEGDGDASE